MRVAVEKLRSPTAEADKQLKGSLVLSSMRIKIYMLVSVLITTIALVAGYTVYHVITSGTLYALPPVIPSFILIFYLSYRLLKTRKAQLAERLLVAAALQLGVNSVGATLVRVLGIERAAERAALQLSRVELSAATGLLLYSSIHAASLLLALYTLMHSVYLVAAAALLSLTPILLRLYLDVKAVARAAAAEEELPYLLLWGWLFERSGLGGLEAALREGLRSGLLRFIGLDSNYDLRRLTTIHPSKRLRRLYSYYIAVRDSGGNAVSFLDDALRNEVEWVRVRLTSYAETITAIGTAFVGSLSAVLVLALFTSFIGSLDVPHIALAVVAVTAAGYMALNAVQPRLRERYNDILLALALTAAGALVALLAVMIGLNRLFTLELSLLASTATAAAVFHVQRLRISKEERELLPLLRVVIEYSRSMGDKPLAKLLEIAALNAEEPLASVAKRAAKGLNPKARSWIVAYTLYTVAELASKQGAIEPLALERLYDLVQTHVVARRAAAARAQLLGLIAAGFPPLVVVASAQLKNLIPHTGTTLLPAPAVALGGIELLAVIASVAAGVLTAKAASLTIRDGLWPLIGLAATLAAQLIAGLL